MQWWVACILLSLSVSATFSLTAELPAAEGETGLWLQTSRSLVAVHPSAAFGILCIPSATCASAVPS